MSNTVPGRLCAAVMAFMGLLLLAQASTAVEPFFGFAVRGIYEDNVIGPDNPNTGAAAGNAAVAADDRGGRLAAPALEAKGNEAGSGGGQDDAFRPATAATGTAGGGAAATQGDFSTNIRIVAGLTHDLSKSTALLLQAGAAHTAYETFDRFDYTIADLRTGVTQYFTGGFSARLQLKAAKKIFRNSLRDSTAYGFSARVKKKFRSSFWVGGTYAFEQNSADSSLYDYEGNSAGIQAGYAFSARTSLTLGYNFLVRDYSAPPPVKVTSNTVFLDGTWKFHDRWSVNAAYTLENTKSGTSGTSATNNIYSAGLLFTY